jgi:hypothetical protein
MKHIYIIIILIIIISIFSCNIKPAKDYERSNIKYVITIIKGNKAVSDEYYYSISEIKFINDNCIKFLEFSYGKCDSAIICGNFVVEKYK